MTTKQEVSYKTSFARRRRAALTDGTWEPFVDSNPARARAAALFAAGYSVPALASAFGLGTSTVKGLLHCRSHQIRTDTSKAILLAVLDCRRMPRNALVPTVGSRRRLHALSRMGWSYQDVAVHLGRGHQAVSSVMDRRRCGAGLAADIARAYDDLWDLVGPRRGVATVARSRGLLGPLHLDDDVIDDPAVRLRGDR